MKYLRMVKKPYFLVIFLLVFLSFLLPKSLKTKKVECLSQFGDCNEKLNNELKAFEGKNLSSSKKGIESLLKNNFTIESYRVAYKLPLAYEVKVLEKKPKFALQATDSGEEIVLVDKDGLAFSGSKNTDLPKLVIKGKLPELGKVLDSKMIFALNLLYDTFVSYQTKEGKLESDTLVIELPGEVRVIFPLEGDREVLSGSLTLLYNQITRKDGKRLVKTDVNIDTIDLRFKNPILKSHYL